MITGRCDRRCAIGTALMSRVFLVAVSNVRMPRSHRTMSRLPRWAMYSAAISHSSIVAFMSALEQHRLVGRADGLQQGEVLHAAGADLQHVGVGGDQVNASRVDHLGDDRQPGLGPDVGQDPQPGLAQALERVRRGARLEGARRAAGSAPAAWAIRAAFERLLGGLDGARARNDGEVSRPDGHAADT